MCDNNKCCSTSAVECQQRLKASDDGGGLPVDPRDGDRGDKESAVAKATKAQPPAKAEQMAQKLAAAAEEAGDEDRDDSDDQPAKPRPNLHRSVGQLFKSDQFNRLETAWPGAFRQRMSVPYGDYDRSSALGKISWAAYALTEKADSIRRGHHAVCPLVRCRKTGTLYRCKIVTSYRVHFNLTTLGFKAHEFEREIRNCLVERQLLFALDHPFLRSGLGFFTDQYCNFGVFLEEFPHGTLLDYYDRDENNRIVSNFEEDALRMIAAQVVLALEYLHCVGCVHRDVQAANLLVDHRGYIKLTDFAISAHLEEPGQQLQAVTCFRYYAAPEYFNGKGYGCPVDFYALGLVLFELLRRECFTEQEDVFDGDGLVDWGIVPDELAVEEYQRRLTQQLLDAQAIQGQAQSSSAAKLAAAAAPLPVKRPIPSAPARAFVEDCLIYEPDCRPDRATARFYDWFAGLDFDRLYAKTLALPWQPPPRPVSYQPDVDEEYPIASVLEPKSLPAEFEPYKHLF